MTIVKKYWLVCSICIPALAYSEPAWAQSESRDAPDVADAEARQRYAAEYVWFEDAYTVGSRPFLLIRGTYAYQGRYKRPLNGKRFYLTIERADLARRYQTRNRIRTALVGGGFAVALGGPIYGFLRVMSCSDSTGCSDKIVEGILISGATMLVGGSLATAGIFLNPHPIPTHEARALADAHNERLRQELGLPEDYEVKPMSYRKMEPIRIAPFVTPQGAGVLISGRL